MAEIQSNKVTMTKTRQRIETECIKKYCPEGNISQYTPKGAGRAMNDSVWWQTHILIRGLASGIRQPTLSHNNDECFQLLVVIIAMQWS